MVKGQVLPNKITDSSLIQAILETPRHNFIPEKFQGVSYIDETIPLGKNRFNLSPIVLSRMLQELNIKKSDSVLDIACGSGYSSAILSHIAKKVIAVESDSDLASKAHLSLKRMNIDNVVIISEILSQGHPDGAPYDIIFINGALNEKPDSLIAQLGESGRLAVVIKKSRHMGIATLFRRIDGIIVEEELFDADVPLIADY